MAQRSALAIGQFPRALLEQVAHFVVADLRELLVPAADRAERLRSDDADDLVRLVPKLLARLSCTGGHGNDNLAGAVLPNGFHCCAHGRACRKSVINQNDDLIVMRARFATQGTTGRSG